MAQQTQFSTYFENLVDNNAKERYISKISIIDNVDPYYLKPKDCAKVNPSEWETFELLPPISFPDLYLYLVEGISPFTKEKFKNYKSMHSYNLFVCGFVRDLVVKKFDSKVLVLATVIHSQRLRETTLKPWVIAADDGTVISAHCTCMAGLDETCSHVGALLFYIEYAIRYREIKTVTGVSAYWSVPVMKQASYSEIWKMNLSSASARKKVLDKILEAPEGEDEVSLTHKTSVLKSKTVPSITTEEHCELEEELFQLGLRCSYFSVHRKFQESYIPKCISAGYPVVLTELYDESKCGLAFNVLLTECQQINIGFRKEQAERVERETRTQSLTKLWHRFRAGRITASNLRKACHSDPAMPSVSLIALICYPTTKLFETAATKWGKSNEETMRKIYIKEMQGKHENFKLDNAGLCLNASYPYLGASPDGSVFCDCCGKGVVEIKCLFKNRDKSCSDLDSKHCLEKTNFGKIQLKRTHDYFYQVQTQLFVTERLYADFCVWTNVDFHIERIYPDREFWGIAKEKSETFFNVAILPELVAKFFTRSSHVPSSTDTVIINPNLNDLTSVKPDMNNHLTNQNKVSTSKIPRPTGKLATTLKTLSKTKKIRKTLSKPNLATTSKISLDFQNQKNIIATDISKVTSAITDLPKPTRAIRDLPKSTSDSTNLTKVTSAATELPKSTHAVPFIPISSILSPSKLQNIIVTPIISPDKCLTPKKSKKVCISPKKQGRPKRSLRNLLSPTKHSNENNPITNKWCYCQGDEDGEMIYCEGENCPNNWYHTECLKIKKIPRGRWFCPDCAKSNREVKKKKAKN